MDLWVTALALSDKMTTAIVLDVDIQILTNQRADQIRQAVSDATKIPIQNIRARRLGRAETRLSLIHI